MKAAQLVAPRKWEIIEEEKPEARDGMMLVRMERVAVCGTDMGHFCGITPPYPMPPGRPGHEGIGIVEDCPSDAFEKGKRVLLYGSDRGLYQEYVLAQPDGCICLPTGVEPEVVLMSQLLGTIIHCFYKLGNLINQKVVVLGQGAVGLLFCAVLRNLGVKQIIGVDPLGYRLEVSRKMGATHIINPFESDVVEAVRDITGGTLADVVVEAVGLEATLNQCVKLARHSGTIVYFGVPMRENAEGVMKLRFGDMFFSEQHLVTSVGPNPHEDYTIALDWIVQGRLDVRPIITHVMPLTQIQKAFEMAFGDPEKDKAIKIVLEV